MERCGLGASCVSPVLATLAVNELVLRNSNASVELEYFFEYTNLQLPLENPRQDIFRALTSPNITNLRDQYDADLVQLLVNSRWVSVAGIAFLGAMPSNGAWLSMADLRFIGANRYTSIHEIGHNLGAEHNETDNCDEFGFFCGNSPDRECANAFRFTLPSGTTRPTVLAIAANFTRVPHLSNLNVLFNTVATGTPDDNNASVVSNTACAVQNYRAWNFGLVISGPLCIGISESNVQPFVPNISLPEGAGVFQQGDYSYHWQFSPDFAPQLRFDFNPIQRGQTLQLSSSLFSTPGRYFIHCTVTSRSGVIVSASTGVQIGGCLQDPYSGPESSLMDESESYDKVVGVDLLGQVVERHSQISNEELLTHYLSNLSAGKVIWYFIKDNATWTRLTFTPSNKPDHAIHN